MPGPLQIPSGSAGQIGINNSVGTLSMFVTNVLSLSRVEAELNRVDQSFGVFFNFFLNFEFLSDFFFREGKTQIIRKSKDKDDGP